MSIAGQEFVFRIREGDREGRKRRKESFKNTFCEFGIFILEILISSMKGKNTELKLLLFLSC